MKCGCTGTSKSRHGSTAPLSAVAPAHCGRVLPICHSPAGRWQQGQRRGPGWPNMPSPSATSRVAQTARIPACASPGSCSLLRVVVCSPTARSVCGAPTPLSAYRSKAVHLPGGKHHLYILTFTFGELLIVIFTGSLPPHICKATSYSKH